MQATPKLSTGQPIDYPHPPTPPLLHFDSWSLLCTLKKAGKGWAAWSQSNTERQTPCSEIRMQQALFAMLYVNVLWFGALPALVGRRYLGQLLLCWLCPLPTPCRCTHPDVCTWQYEWTVQEPHNRHVKGRPELSPILSMTVNIDQH